MRRNVALAVLGLLGSACSGPPTPSRPLPRTDAELAYPAAAWLPADASWAVTATRTTELVALARELSAAVETGLGVESGRIRSRARLLLGVDPASPDAVEAIGLDLHRGAAVFSAGLLPAVALPVADADRLDAFLAASRPDEPIRLRRHRGHEIRTWRLGAATAVSMVRVPGWLLAALHVDLSGDGDDWLRDDRWLDGALTAREGRGLAAGSAMARALASTRDELDTPGAPAVLGVVDGARVARALDAVAPGCRRALRVVRSVTLAAQVDWKSAKGAIAVELTEAAAAALAANAAPVSSGWRGYRDQAALAAGVAVDPSWLAGLARGSGCPVLGQLVGGVQLPATAPAAIHAAVSELDRDARRFVGGIHAVLRDRRFADGLLARIPQRRLLERERTIAGQRVFVVNIPFVAKIVYRLTDREFTAVIGGGEIAEILASPEPPTGPRELAVVAARPGRSSSLNALLVEIASLTGLASSSLALLVAERLARYHHGRLALTLDGRRLVLRGDMRLR